MQALRPADFVHHEELTFNPVNMEKLREKGRDLAISNLKIRRYPVQALLKGTMTTEGINHQTHDLYGDRHTFGLQLEEQEDADALRTLSDSIASKVIKPYISQDDEDYTIAEVLKDEVLYLKCKTNKDGTKFLFTSNYKLRPGKPNPEVKRYMHVECIAEVAAYINPEELKAGLFFTIKELRLSSDEDLEMAKEQYVVDRDRVKTKKGAAAIRPSKPKTIPGKRKVTLEDTDGEESSTPSTPSKTPKVTVKRVSSVTPPKAPSKRRA